MTERIPARVAAQVKARAAGRCEYCHAPQVLVGQAFHIDHIIPRSAGGPSAADNLCLACSHCNIAKGDRTAGETAAIDLQARRFMAVSAGAWRYLGWRVHDASASRSAVVSGEGSETRGGVVSQC